MAVRITSHAIGLVARADATRRPASGCGTAIRAANEAIFERTLSEHDKRGMGTTATVLVLLPGRYLIGQVGDSRAYLLRDGRFLQLTKDHSYVQEQVDAGLLTPDQARVHPYSNVITRCVGASGDVVPDIYFGTLEQGDVLLLASDGLTGMLEDEQLDPHPDLRRRPPALGGPDDHRGQPARGTGQHHRHRGEDRFRRKQHRRAAGAPGGGRRRLLAAHRSTSHAPENSRIMPATRTRSSGRWERSSTPL